jgi:hypothetical protein
MSEVVTNSEPTTDNDCHELVAFKHHHGTVISLFDDIKSADNLYIPSFSPPI